jgi:hypothetical protein
MAVLRQSFNGKPQALADLTTPSLRLAVKRGNCLSRDPKSSGKAAHPSELWRVQLRVGGCFRND